MLNKSTSRSEYVIQSGVTPYPIGFAFQYNGDDTPQIRVTIGAMVAEENVHFVITEDLLNIKLIPLEEEAPEDPNDYSWLEKWVGMSLVIERDIPFVQESDYQVGRISSERIEKDFDLSVMRDQVLDDKIDDARDEFVEANKSLSDKIDETKSELQKSIDDKLPLTGGTLTGPLTIIGDGPAPTVLSLKHGDSGVVHRIVVSESNVQMPFKLIGMHSISPSVFNGPHSLGSDRSRWDTVYTTKISNGSDILVPEKAGTMALLEDVEPKADKTELQNYLPLTGGSFMTSWIGFDGVFGANVNRGIITVQTAAGVKGLVGAATDENGKFKDIAVIDKLKGTTVQYTNVLASQIGSATSPVPRLFAKKIGSTNSNKMITIPEKSGTMACLDDIPETYTKEELDAKFAEIPAPIDAYTKAEVDAKLSSVYKFKGSVANVDALPTGASVGDTYNVEDTGANYAWDGSNWDKLSDTVDLSDYATNEYAEELYFDLHGKLDKEITKRSSEDTKLYNDQMVLRDMLNEKDENEEFIQLTTEAQTAIPAINELNEKKASKEDLSGYLPLSGGDVTGKIGFGRSSVLGTLGGLRFISEGAYYDMLSSAFYPLVKEASLGAKSHPWSVVYAPKLNNGADLIVPTEGGTLARLEDLEGIGGGGASLPDQADNAGKVLRTNGASAEWTDDYVPATGGRLWGDLEFGTKDSTLNLMKMWGQGFTLQIGQKKDSYGYGDFMFHPSYGAFLPTTNKSKNLGANNYRFKTIYCGFIDNGRQITIPEKAGTMALVEDITATVGDISTALTAILGE